MMKDVIKKMDLNFFASAQHRLKLDEFKKLFMEDKVVAIDVRSREENEMMSFKFAKNIPLNELPEHLDEIPKDKAVAVFCPGKTRGAIAYCFLQSLGMKNVRMLDGGELMGALKPGFVAELSK